MAQAVGLDAEALAALRESVARLLQRRCAEADVRRVMDTPDGFDRDLWRDLAGLGVAGLVVDEAYGGSGSGPVALEQVMEEAGAVLLPSPVLAGVLAAGLLQALGDAAACARLLPGVADASRIVAVALTGESGSLAPDAVTVAAKPAPDGGALLNGKASFVLSGQAADTLLVVAWGLDSDWRICEVDAWAPGVTLTALPTFDGTLRLAEATFADAPAQPLSGTTPVWRALEEALDLARIALAGEQAGAARRLLDITVDYAKSRIQFGRPIGSFQAIKHMAADLLLEVESALSAARHAAQALASGAPEARAAVPLAAFACGEAFVRVAADAIQMHGGIAFTWSHPAHLYLRRARADAELLGGLALHRERYLQAMGG